MNPDQLRIERDRHSVQAHPVGSLRGWTDSLRFQERKHVSQKEAACERPH